MTAPPKDQEGPGLGSGAHRASWAEGTDTRATVEENLELPGLRTVLDARTLPG